MIVTPQRSQHDVTYNIGVIRHLDTNRIFDSVHRCQSMYPGTYTTNTFNKRPGVTRVTALQNDLQPAEHGAAGNGIGNDVLLINVHFAAHMPFDAGNRVHDQTTAGVVNGITLGLILVTHACLSSLSGCCSACANCCLWRLRWLSALATA